jgi:hypothetical protein
LREISSGSVKFELVRKGPQKLPAVQTLDRTTGPVLPSR